MKKNNNRIKPTSQNLTGYMFIAPVAITMIVLIVYPLCYGLYISFFKTNLVNKWNFIGIKNYVTILKDHGFYESIETTLLFSLFVVIGHFVIGFVLANALNKKIKGLTIFRGILLLPWLFPEAVIALVFKWILNPIYGILNHALTSLHLITDPISWLGTTKYAFPVLVFACIWKGYPMVMTMILAGLQNIPRDYYEAARLDGCSKWQEFRYITLPGLRSVLTATLVLDTVWWFKHYTMAWVLTQGGPGRSTSLISIEIFKTAFEYFDFGKAAAISVFVFGICFAISKGFRKVLNDED